MTTTTQWQAKTDATNPWADRVVVKFQDRVQHIVSEIPSSDDELLFAQSLAKEAEHIEVVTATDGKPGALVTVSTQTGVYHFGAQRADYVGHSSRTLLSLLQHFGCVLPMDFVVAHPNLSIDLVSERIQAGNQTYALGLRAEGLTLVEPVSWLLSTSALETLHDLAERYGIDPVHLVEDTISLLAERLSP